jgi:CO dehydrogenase maturation factor
VQWLVNNGRTPVLAIDADSNANLHELLGITVSATVGGIREEARSIVKADPGIAKHEYLELQVQRAVVERSGYDFLAMGRPEGPGCYCYANNVLRDVIERLASSYRYLVVDCEAGLEHLSRRTLISIDCLVIVSDPTMRGLHTAVRIGQVVEEMKTRVRTKGLIINKIPENYTFSEEQHSDFSDETYSFIHTIPIDAVINRNDQKGIPITALDGATGAQKAIDSLMRRLLSENPPTIN